jgi:hypothetical protein
MTTDTFKGQKKLGPITAGELVDLGTTDYVPDTLPRAIYVSVAGAVKMDLVGGGTVTIPTLVAGWHWIRPTKIYKTGTAATGLFAGW